MADVVGVFHVSLGVLSALIIALALGSIVGSLMLLRDSAKKLPLDAEQLKRIKARNVEQEARDQRDA